MSACCWLERRWRRVGARGSSCETGRHSSSHNPPGVGVDQQARAVGRESSLSEQVDDWPLAGRAGIACRSFLLNPDKAIHRLMPVQESAPCGPKLPQGEDSFRVVAKPRFTSRTRSLCWYLVGCLAPLAAENPRLQQLLLCAVADSESLGRGGGSMLKD